MKQLSFLALLLVVVPGLGWALTGDPQAGKTKALACMACHGAGGNSTVPAWPKLAGQNERYIVEQTRAFKQGSKGPRYQAVMSAAVIHLSEQDMADIGAYYAKQQVSVGTTAPEALALGEALYRGGDIKRGIPACGTSCHGPQGLGNAQAGFPALSGQHAAYTIAQLKAYKDGTRKTGPNNIMQEIASQLTDADMEALAQYIQGLH